MMVQRALCSTWKEMKRKRRTGFWSVKRGGMRMKNVMRWDGMMMKKKEIDRKDELKERLGVIESVIQCLWLPCYIRI